VRPTAWQFRGGAAGGVIAVTLREGRTRVVRRLAAQLGLGVRSLVRVAYGPVLLGDQPKGQVRPLSRREIAALYRVLGMALPAPDREDEGR
jgi:23S rRNA pseudouridine2605 synthase